MRLAAPLALLATAAAAAWAGAGLVQTLQAPDHAPVVAETRGPERTAPAAVLVAQDWPALFGTPPVALAETAPAAPPVPYALKGLLATNANSWAILAGADWDGVVQVGDTLSSGERVVAIDLAGVVLEADGGERRITFDDAAPVQVSRAEIPVGDSGAVEPAELRMQGVDQVRLREMLDRARAVQARQAPAAQ